ncbi:MAG: cytochrome P450, partial [Verrucomicrobiota bacterium]
PPHPPPIPDGEKRSLWQWIQRTRKSAIHTLYEGSFRNWITVVKLPWRKLFVPKHPEDVRRVLVEEAKLYPKSESMHLALEPLLGNSIFTTNGEVWERQRRLLNPAFADNGLKKVFPLMQEAVTDLLGRLDHFENEECPIGDEMTHVTADIIMRTILSYPLGADEAMDLARRFERFQMKASIVNMLVSMRLPRWILPRNWLIWRSEGKKIRSLLGQIISSRYKEFHSNTKTGYGDILEGLMSTIDPVTETSFSEKELVDQIVMLFLAGHETSASALGWTLFILAHQPHYVDAIRKEVRESCPDSSNLRFNEVSKLKFTRAIFKESLRIYPPVPFFSRSACQAGEIQNRPIQSGDLVNLSPYLVHRHESLWQQPDEFRPERFLSGTAEKINSSQYFPFSMGPRICIGAAFAQQEALLTLIRICESFDLEPVDGFVPEAVSRLTLRSENGIRIRIKRRPAA